MMKPKVHLLFFIVAAYFFIPSCRIPNRHEWLNKESWSRGGLFGLWPNMSPASNYAKSFIKLPLDEVDEGSLKLTN